jgi:hypothetical protein
MATASGSEEVYFLRTAAHPSTPNSTRFSNLHVRHHGSVNSIMLVAGPPKFLRFHLSESGRQHATSWKHPGRTWGFVLGNEDGKHLGGCAEVQIVEGEADPGFTWRSETPNGKEVLEHEGKGNDCSWSGWMACEWCHGHPQLFWVTSNQTQLPDFCERVVLVREPVYGQPAEVVDAA